MKARRITESVERGGKVRLTINGLPVFAYAGETVATVLLAQRITTFNVTRKGEPRGPYCNMGTCFECQVRVTGPASSDFQWMRACMVPVQPGMAITTGTGFTDRAEN